MSDFFSSGWHWFIAAVSVGGLAFCIWLLFASSNAAADAAISRRPAFLSSLCVAWESSGIARP